MQNNDTYNITITKTTGEEILFLSGQDINEVNDLIEERLEEGYPYPEFNGVLQELDYESDIIIEHTDISCDGDGCGYDKVLDYEFSE